jgi:hypothetical protein
MTTSTVTSRRRAARRRGRAARLGPARLAAGALAVAAGTFLFLPSPTPADAGGGITPGLAAGGVPLSADVAVVDRILGRPTDELRDPTNPFIFIQRWEPLCLGARYTPKGELLALDVWFDLGAACGSVGGQYAVNGSGSAPVSFRSTRADVKQAFGYRPERVLRDPHFTILVYEAAGVAFYIREEGQRDGLVDAITVFPRESSTSVWAPGSWGHR